MTTATMDPVGTQVAGISDILGFTQVYSKDGGEHVLNIKTVQRIFRLSGCLKSKQTGFLSSQLSIQHIKFLIQSRQFSMVP